MRRTALGRLVGEVDAPRLDTRDGVTFELEEYSRFKYGDGMAAERLGAQLARLALEDGLLGGMPVMLTTSAFRRTPPAAYSLLAPFLAEVHRSAGPTLAPVRRFRLVREQISTSDYATMDASARAKALTQDQVSVAEGVDLAGRTVLAIDDIRVTGVHEQAVDTALRLAGAGEIEHLYVIDAGAFAEHPEVEAAVNATAVNDADDLIALSRTPRFIPNARFCKAVVSLPEPQQERFVHVAGSRLVDWVLTAADGEGLGEHTAYAEGLARLRSAALPAVV